MLEENEWITEIRYIGCFLNSGSFYSFKHDIKTWTGFFNQGIFAFGEI